MSERRSARATKGVHTKLNDPEPEPPAPKQKSAKGKSKKSQEPEVEEEEEDKIRCVGDDYIEEEDRAMICCDACDVWQHNTCMGMPSKEKDVEKMGKNYKYYCEECKPDFHTELLEAMDQGRKPWKDDGWLREDMKQFVAGRKGRGGRPSLPVKEESTTEAKVKTPTPAPTSAADKSKRKQSMGAEGSEQPAKLPKPSAQDKAGAEVTTTSRKASSGGRKTQKNAPKTTEAVSSIEQLDGPRKKLAEALQKKFEEKIKALSGAQKFRIPDAHTPSSLSADTAILVENALFLEYAQGPKPDFGGHYRGQYMTISSNTSSNDDLMIRILNAQISAQQLATMSSDDMASEEMQQEAARLKELADKQSTLVQEDSGRPHVRRTHKGEEYVEDPNEGVTNAFVPPPAPVRRESDFLPPQSPTVGQDVIMTDDGLPSAPEHRRSSSNFNIKNVWDSVQSPDRTQPATGYTPTAPNHRAEQPPPKNEGDAAIDRLLQDDDEMEDAPYSPHEYEGPKSTWTGTFEMPHVAEFPAAAQHIAGADLSSRLNMRNLFPETLKMSGRIPGSKADEYLSTLGSARHTDVVVFNLTPSDASEGSDTYKHFRKVYQYFVDRDRWGVVGDNMHRENVSDTYIIPVAGGLGEVPKFLSRLDHNDIESPPARDMLLAIFVVKWNKNPQQAMQPPPINTQPSTLSPAGAAGTPSAPGQSVMSPLATPAPGQGFPPPSNQQQVPLHGQPAQGFPENPYASTSAPRQNGQALAHQILGEFYTCATAQTVLVAHPEFPEPLLHNLRNILEQYPQSRTDLGEFQRILDSQHQQGGS